MKEQDELFVKEIKKQLDKVSKRTGKTGAEMRKNYVPMAERWKNEKL